MRVDLKSVLLGGILVLALFIISGLTNKPAKSVARYQIVMATPDFPVDTAFLLDTKTGLSYVYVIQRDSTTDKIIGGRWGLTLMDSLSFDVYNSHYDE